MMQFNNAKMIMFSQPDIDDYPPPQAKNLSSCGCNLVTRRTRDAENAGSNPVS